MDDTENKFKKLLKSEEMPEISSDFTSNVMNEIKLLPKPNSVKNKPLIHPLILWLSSLLLISVAIILNLNGLTIEFKFTDFFSNFKLFDYLKLISRNYLITAFAFLVLFWFLIDYKLLNLKKEKLLKKKN